MLQYPFLSESARKFISGVPLPLRRSLMVMTLAGFTLGLCVLTKSPESSTEAGVTLDLPYHLGDWWGTAQEESEAEKSILPEDTAFVRKNYESGEGDNIICSIVLSGAEKRSIHRPEICLPGQGWTVKSSQVVDIPLHSGRVLKAMNLTITHPITLATGRQIQVPAYYLYWFVGAHGLVTPYHWERIWLTSWDRVMHQVNHRWAYVIVHSLITEGLKPGGKSPEATLAMMKRFTADIVPSFEKGE